MAIQSTLDIRIRALVEGLDELRRLADQLGQAGLQATQAGAQAGGAGEGMEQMAEGAKKGAEGAKDFNDNIKGMSDGATKFTDLIKKAAVAFTAFLAIRGIKEMADAAARVETLGVTLEVVGRNAGYSKEQLTQYEAELRKLGISTGAARESLTKMIQAGLNLNAVNEKGVTLAAQLARASQDLAVVTGENSSETLRRLIINIQQMDTVGLRFQGLTVNIAGAQEKFAASIGKTADQLTQQQKIQAVANATLDEAAKLQGAYEKSLETVGKKLGSLSRYQEEAAVSIGNSLVPAYGALVDAATETLKVIAEIADEVSKQGDVAAGLKDLVESVVTPLSNLISSVVKGVAELSPTVIAAVGPIGDFVGVLFDLAGALVEIVTTSELVKGTILWLGGFFAAVKDGATVLSVALAGLGLAFIKLGEFALRALAGVQQFLGFDEAAAKTRELADAMKKQADETQAAMEQTIQSYMDGGSALLQYSRDLQENAKRQEEAAKSNTKAYKDTDAAITGLKERIRENKVTSTEAAAEMQRLQGRIEALGKSGELTKGQVAELSQRLRSMAAEDADKANKAISDLGLSLQSIGSVKFLEKVDTEFGEVATSLQELAVNASITDERFQQAFSKGIDTTKTVANIATLANSLRDAQKSGKDVKEETEILGSTFTRVFNEELKSVKTQADMDLLRKKIVAVKDTYPELKKEAEAALTAISRAQAAGGTSALEKAKQSLDLAKQQTAAYQAQISVRRAEVNLAEKVSAVEKARIAVTKENTTLNRAKLQLAQAEEQLARTELAMARTKADVEQQNMRVMIAQQKALNAEKAAGQGKISQAEADALTQKAEAQEVILSQKLEELERQDQNVDAQQQQVDELRKAVEKQQQLNDEMNKQKEAAGSNNQNASQLRETFNSLIPTASGMNAELLNIGLSISKAKELSEQWYRSIGQGGVGSSFQQVWEGIQLMENNLRMAKESSAAMAGQAEAMMAQFQKAKDEAMGIKEGFDTVLPGMAAGTAGARAYAAAVRQIKEEAKQVGKAAEESARSFVASAESISQELLSAQGKDEEVIKARTEARKAELTVQYEMLKVQLQIAIATARAAKVDTKDLEAALRDASASYRNAQQDLTKIQEIELRKRRDQRNADREQERAAERKALDDKRQDYGTSAQLENDAKAALSRLTENTAGQAARASSSPSGSGADAAQSIAQAFSSVQAANPPTKVIQLDLTAGNTRVPASIASDDETALLKILELARGVST